MSMTAGERPWPLSGRETSPTRLTPSLAGIVTSDFLVIAAAGAAQASRVRAVKAAAIRGTKAPNAGATPNLLDVLWLVARSTLWSAVARDTHRRGARGTGSGHRRRAARAAARRAG